MCRPPFARKGKQAACGLEVAPAKRLQRVLGSALGQYLAGPSGRQVIAQLRHQHRGRLLTVVAHAAPAPADVQDTAGRQQGFEHQLAVVVTARAVAWANLPCQPHQVKVAALGAARVITIVHAQQANHLERNGAHRHQGAKGHAASPKALVERRLLQRVQPGLPGH